MWVCVGNGGGAVKGAEQTGISVSRKLITNFYGLGSCTYLRPSKKEREQSKN